MQALVYLFLKCNLHMITYSVFSFAILNAHRLLFICSGMVAALTNESATSKSVYFAHCTSEMIFITHLLTKEPEKLAGPLLADTYVTLLKGRNAWYGQMIAKEKLSLDMGDSFTGKGMIQVLISISFTCHFRLPHMVHLDQW